MGYSPGGHQEWGMTEHLSTQSHTVTDGAYSHPCSQVFLPTKPGKTKLLFVRLTWGD